MEAGTQHMYTIARLTSDRGPLPPGGHGPPLRTATSEGPTMVGLLLGKAMVCISIGCQYKLPLYSTVWLQFAMQV